MYLKQVMNLKQKVNNMDKIGPDNIDIVMDNFMDTYNKWHSLVRTPISDKSFLIALLITASMRKKWNVVIDIMNKVDKSIIDEDIIYYLVYECTPAIYKLDKQIQLKIEEYFKEKYKSDFDREKLVYETKDNNLKKYFSNIFGIEGIDDNIMLKKLKLHQYKLLLDRCDNDDEINICMKYIEKLEKDIDELENNR